MGVLTRLFEERSTTLATPEKWLVEWFTGRETASGIPISPATALEFPALYAAVRIISETIASLPLHLYRRLTPRGKERAADYPLYDLLHSEPNPEIGRLRFSELLTSHTLLWGNAYAEIQRNRAMRPIALWPLLPDRTWAERVKGVKRFKTVVDGQQFTLAQDQVLHVAGLGFDGLRGYSPITLEREAIALGLAGQEFAARFFSNDAKFGVVLQHPKTISDPAYKRLTASWDARAGLEHAHRTKILEEGMTLERIGMPLRDAQFIEGRKFSIADIARIYRIPLALLEEHDKAATYASVEQFMLSFVVHTIRPWLVRWEEAINLQIIPESDRKTIFAEHLVEGLLRGDTLARYQAYQIGRQGGWLSANDIRELENQNPIDGGDIYMVPLNMMPASDAMPVGDGGVGSTVPSGATEPPQVFMWHASLGVLSVNEVRKYLGYDPVSGGDVPAIKYLEDLGIQLPPALSAEGNGGTEEQNSLRRIAEAYRQFGALPKTETRDGRNRRRLAKSFEQVVADAGLRILKRETKEVLRLAKKHLSSRALPAFLEAVETFYLSRPAWIRQLIAAPLLTYADAVESEAAREVGREPAQTDTIDAVKSSYLDGYLQRHVESSLGQIKDVTRTATEGNQDPIEALQSRFSEWEQTRPSKIAGRETVQMGAAVAKAVFVAAGFMRLVWRSAGASCPYCTKLDGKTVEIHKFFVNEGDDVWPREEEGPMEIRRPVGHPPLHAGCDCVIAQG